MYAVSDAYKTAIEQPVQHHDLRGTVGAVPFGRQNILNGSFEITNQCSGNVSLEIGQVYAGQLTATFTGLGISRYSWRGLRVAPEFGLQLADGTWEWVPLGVYIISEADQTESGVQVTAYDAMVSLDKTLLQTLQGLTPYQIASMGCAACGVELGQTAEEMSALTNGAETLYMSADGDVQTWRDVFSWLAQTLACFCTAGRDGKIYFRQFGRTAVDVVDNYHRFTGCSFADYETRYTGVSVVSVANKVTRYYALPVDDGLTYNLGSNPFLQLESEPEIEQRARSILAALQSVRYVPFDVTAYADPAYDLGDVLRFADGIADGTKLSCLTLFDYKFQGEYHMAGVGENPALATAMSKTDKALSGLMSNGSDAFRIKATRNEEQITIADQAQPVEVLSVRYSTASNSLILVQAEIRIDITTTETGDAATGWTCNDAVCRVTYVSDGVEIEGHHPIETWQDGQHILSLIQDLLVAQNYRHEFKILLEIGGGTGVVAPQDGAIYISGIGVDDEITDAPYPPEQRYLMYIAVTTPPTKTTYQVGEALDYTGVVVTAYYSDDTEAIVTTSCTFTPADGTETTEAGPLMVNVVYTEAGQTYTAYFDVVVEEPVEPYVTGIYVFNQPDKTTHAAGDAVDYTGVVIMATWSDGWESNVTEDCTYTPADGSTVEDGAVTVLVEYNDGETVHNTSFELESAAEKRLVSIAVTTMPTRTTYTTGAAVDYTGMVVTATYSDSTTAVVTPDCIISPAQGTTLTTAGRVSVGVEYTEGQNTAITSFEISVVDVDRRLSSIAVTRQPNITVYAVGDTAEYDGLQITAYYTDGTTAVVTASCSFSPAEGFEFESIGTVTVSTSYTESGVTRTAAFDLRATTATHLNRSIGSNRYAEGAISINRVSEGG